MTMKPKSRINWIHSLSCWLMCMFIISCQTSTPFEQASENPSPIKLPDRHLEALTPSLASQSCIVNAEELVKNREYARAIVWYEEARTRDQISPKAELELARLYAQLGDLPNAEATYQRVINRSPQTSEYTLELAEMFQKNQKWGQAAETYQKYLAISPDDYPAWNQLGISLAQEGKLKESQIALTRVLSLAEAQYNIGVILLRSGKTKEGRTYLKRAVDTDPELDQAIQILQYYPEPSGASKTEKTDDSPK